MVSDSDNEDDSLHKLDSPFSAPYPPSSSNPLRFHRRNLADHSLGRWLSPRSDSRCLSQEEVIALMGDAIVHHHHESVVADWTERGAIRIRTEWSWSDDAPCGRVPARSRFTAGKIGRVSCMCLRVSKTCKRVDLDTCYREILKMISS